MQEAGDSKGESSSSNPAYPSANPETSETAPLLVSGEDGSHPTPQRKDKFPAWRGGTSSAYGATPPPEGRHQSEAPNTLWSEHNRLRICFAFVLFIGLSLVMTLMLILMAPGFAQRSLKDDVEFDFVEALSQKASWLFGSISMQDTNLQIFYTPDTPAVPPQPSRGAMGTIALPMLSLQRDSSITRFDFVTQIVIEDDSALISFCEDAVALKTVNWKLMGEFMLQIGWLPVRGNLQLDKIVSLEGMDGLRHAEIQSISFPGPHSLGGIALQGVVGIYNPSNTLSFNLGDVDFGIYLPTEDSRQNDVMIAVVRAEGAKLLGKQMNEFSVSGRSILLDDDNTNGKLLMERFLSSYLHGNVTTVLVRGSAFGPDDSSTVSSTTPVWLRKALESITLNVPFPGTKQTDLIRSLELTNIKIDFGQSGDPLISGDIDAWLKKPDEMQFSMNVTEISPTVFLYLEANSTKPFGRVSPETPCAANTIENDDTLPKGTVKVKSRLDKAPFSVIEDDDFQKFLAKIFNGEHSKVFIQGSADAKVDSAFGHLMVRGLKFKGEIETQGMKGMKDPPPKVTSMSIVQGYPRAIQAMTTLVIENPSDIHVNLGEVNLLLLYENQSIGNTTIQEMLLAPHTANEITASVWLYFFSSAKADQQKMIDFVGKYISVSPPPFDAEPLLADMQINILSSTAVLWLRNPFPDVLMQIMQINATASYEHQEIGSSYANFTDKGEGWKGPIVLPPLLCGSGSENCTGTVVETPKIPVMTKKLGFEAIRQALGGQIEVSVNSTVVVMVDSFILDNLVYRRDNLTAKVRKGF
ncbi:hypothetical protein DFQ28_009875 [Apophysomyces sp. BC1034]|nr:hypothetical protein DFQ28_009875 [Apophysomyces sp. BC1034]